MAIFLFRPWTFGSSWLAVQNYRPSSWGHTLTSTTRSDQLARRLIAGNRRAVSCLGLSCALHLATPQKNRVDFDLRHVTQLYSEDTRHIIALPQYHTSHVLPHSSIPPLIDTESLLFLDLLIPFRHCYSLIKNKLYLTISFFPAYGVPSITSLDNNTSNAHSAVCGVDAMRAAIVSQQYRSRCRGYVTCCDTVFSHADHTSFTSTTFGQFLCRFIIEVVYNCSLTNITNES